MDYSEYNVEDFAANESFQHYVLGSAEEDVKFWNEWLEQHPDKWEEANKARDIILGLSLQLPQEEFEQEYQKIKAFVSQQPELPKKEIVKPRSYLFGSIAAAVVLLVIAFMAWQVSKEPTSEILVASTLAGEKKEIHLEDGSTVLLNGESTLKYPEHFDGKLRAVELQGRAFFDVKKDENKPFQVKSKYLTTEVLGTTFVVDAYPSDSNEDISLLTGKVKVRSNIDSRKELAVLTPNQQLHFVQKDQSYQIKTFQTDDVIGWKNNILVFNNIPFTKVVKELELCYGIKIEIENLPNHIKSFTGKFKQQPLSNVLEGLKFSFGFDYYSVDKKHIVLKFNY
ncbi:FecR domain-containing protein [Limibacter armeniacum]|uniref:FecR family protein n=1 Tax=Limibacter armeniacum TaxID=466084 RepID=UPI002FE5F4EC